MKIWDIKLALTYYFNAYQHVLKTQEEISEDRQHAASRCIMENCPVMFCGMTKVPQADGVCRAVVQVITTVNNSYESGKGLRGK